MTARTVRELMTSPVLTIGEDDRLSDALKRMETRDVSALPVLDATQRICGILSRTDLLRAGRVQLIGERRERVLSLPDARAREHMSPRVEIESPSALLADAARRMVKHHHHRVVISDDRVPIGIVSTREMMRAVAEEGMATPIGALVRGALIVVESAAPLKLALDRLVAAQIHGVVVMEGGWPVGIFAQDDALAARDASPDDAVELWMDPRLICVAAALPAHHAARQAHQTRAGRVIVVDGPLVRGVVTGTDFARLVAGAVP